MYQYGFDCFALGMNHADLSLILVSCLLLHIQYLQRTTYSMIEAEQKLGIAIRKWYNYKT